MLPKMNKKKCGNVLNKTTSVLALRNPYGVRPIEKSKDD